MSKPHPEFLHAPSGCQGLITEALSSEDMNQEKIAGAMEKLRSQATTPLKPTGQASGSSMGFFDQGILTGIIAFVLPVVCLIGAGGFIAGRSAIRRIF